MSFLKQSLDNIKVWINEKISEMKEKESRKIHSIIVTLMVKSYQMSKDV